MSNRIEETGWFDLMIIYWLKWNFSFRLCCSNQSWIHEFPMVPNGMQMIRERESCLVKTENFDLKSSDHEEFDCSIRSTPPLKKKKDQSVSPCHWKKRSWSKNFWSWRSAMIWKHHSNSLIDWLKQMRKKWRRDYISLYGVCTR